MFEVAYVGAGPSRWPPLPTISSARSTSKRTSLIPSTSPWRRPAPRGEQSHVRLYYRQQRLGRADYSAIAVAAPLPQYINVTRNAPALGNTVYHSAQLKLEKRFSQGLSALVSYTLSKNIGDLNNAQNNYNRRESGH